MFHLCFVNAFYQCKSCLMQVLEENNEFHILSLNSVSKNQQFLQKISQKDQKNLSRHRHFSIKVIFPT